MSCATTEPYVSVSSSEFCRFARKKAWDKAVGERTAGGQEQRTPPGPYDLVAGAPGVLTDLLELFRSGGHGRELSRAFAPTPETTAT